MEFIVAIVIVIWISAYYILKFAREGKIKVYYGWLAYSLRPILFSFALGFFLIFGGTDWKSPFWELIAGLLIVLGCQYG